MNIERLLPVSGYAARSGGKQSVGHAAADAQRVISRVCRVEAFILKHEVPAGGTSSGRMRSLVTCCSGTPAEGNADDHSC
jgi:hypothetical protein